MKQPWHRIAPGRVGEQQFQLPESDGARNFSRLWVIRPGIALAIRHRFPTAALGHQRRVSGRVARGERQIDPRLHALIADPPGVAAAGFAAFAVDFDAHHGGGDVAVEGLVRGRAHGVAAHENRGAGGIRDGAVSGNSSERGGGGMVVCGGVGFIPADEPFDVGGTRGLRIDLGRGGGGGYRLPDASPVAGAGQHRGEAIGHIVDRLGVHRPFPGGEADSASISRKVGWSRDPLVLPGGLLKLVQRQHQRQPRMTAGLHHGIALGRGAQRNRRQGQQSHCQQGQQHHQTERDDQRKPVALGASEIFGIGDHRGLMAVANRGLSGFLRE